MTTAATRAPVTGRASAGLQQGWLGVFAMGVLVDHRRRGLGRQVLVAHGAWGASLGASRAYLQVEVGNTAARSLYAEAGLEPAYDDSYWSPRDH